MRGFINTKYPDFYRKTYYNIHCKRLITKRKVNSTIFTLTMRYTYSKNDKLKSKKLIDALFIEGRSVKSYPLRMVYLQETLPKEEVLIQVGVSVSKRNFKLAVARNRIKRLMRESYRFHKESIDTKGTTFAALIIYTGHQEVSQNDLHKAMIKLIKRFNDAITTSSS